jgi:hypothetical protein
MTVSKKPKKQRDITNELAILQYMHCGRCLDEWKAGETGSDVPISMSTYAELSTGFTALGLQVWCKRHSCNVVHIDFEGQCHPANTTRKEGA